MYEKFYGKYRAITGYENYELCCVSDNEYVVKKKAVPNKNNIPNQFHNKSIVLKQYTKRYVYVNIESKPVLLHRLIVLAFPDIYGELTNDLCVHHIDHNPYNNLLSNLVIMDKVEHAKLHGVSYISNSKRTVKLLGKKLSEEHRKKLSESHKGKTHSVETKTKMAKTMRGYYKTHKKIISPEARLKISKSLKGKYTGFDSTHGKPINQYTIEGELVCKYGSALDAAKKNGFRRECIRDCCSGRQKTAYGFKWSYAS